MLLLQSTWSEVETALIIGLAVLLAAILAFITAVFKNENLRAAVVGKLINKVKGGQMTTIDDIKNHDIKIKLQSYAISGMHKAINVIKDYNKRLLFKDYVLLFTGVFLESIDNITNSDIVNMDEFGLKQLILNQTDWRRNQYAERFTKLLQSKSSNLNDINLVVAKIEEWRSLECELITENVVTVIGNGKFNSIISKLDTILNQYSLGIDFLIKNGAESFERLNGQLDTFLNVSTR